VRNLSNILDESQENTVHGKNDLICYCFKYTTRGDIEQDYIKNGQSLIMDNIMAAKKIGGCDFAIKNPKGR